MRHEITIICDDIRQETGQKISLMGIYDDSLVVKLLPARLPKLCFFQRWAESNLKPNDEIRLQISGSALISSIPMLCKIQAAHFNPEATKAQILLAIAPLDLARAGEIEFLTYLSDSDEPSHRHLLEV